MLEAQNCTKVFDRHAAPMSLVPTLERMSVRAQAHGYVQCVCVSSCVRGGAAGSVQFCAPRDTASRAGEVGPVPTLRSNIHMPPKPFLFARSCPLLLTMSSPSGSLQLQKKTKKKNIASGIVLDLPWSSNTRLPQFDTVDKQNRNTASPSTYRNVTNNQRLREEGAVFTSPSLLAAPASRLLCMSPRRDEQYPSIKSSLPLPSEGIPSTNSYDCESSLMHGPT